MSLSFEEQRRYVRQIQCAGFGEAAQLTLKQSRVLVVGAGGLGSAVLSYLAAAGVGTIGVIDDDRVELSNLNRQIIHETGDVGRLKAESAYDRIEELNPHVTVQHYAMKLDAANAEAIIAEYDVVADGCDNFETRFVVNRSCIALRKPLVSAAVRGWDGQLASFAPHLVPHSACYQCLVSPDAPEINTCREAGIIGPLCGVLGSLQSMEVLHWLLGSPALVSRLLIVNGRNFNQRIVSLAPDESCGACNPSIA